MLDLTNLTFTRRETAFYYFMQCIGVNFFKKYYPNMGSYWNKTKEVNKMNSESMNDYISTCESNRKFHIIQATSITMMYIVMAFVNPEVIYSIFKAFVGYTIFEMYTILVQTYNIMLLKKQINYVITNKLDTKPDYEKLRLKRKIMEIDLPKNGFYSLNTIAKSYYFVTVEEAVSFSFYICDKYDLINICSDTKSVNFIFNHANMGKNFDEEYREFIARKHLKLQSTTSIEKQNLSETDDKYIDDSEIDNLLTCIKTSKERLIRLPMILE